MKSIYLICLIAFNCFAGEPAAVIPPASQVVVSKFFECVKNGDAVAASMLVFKCPGTEEQTESRVRTIVETGKNLGTAPKPISNLEKSSLAMVIVQDTATRPDGKPDFDGVLMIKRNQKWLVVMSIAELEDSTGILSAEERKELESVNDWQNSKMQELSVIKTDVK